MLLVDTRRMDHSISIAAKGKMDDMDASVHGASGDLQDKKFFLSGETGAYKYLAPEVYRHERYSLKCARTHPSCPRIP